MFGTIDLDDAKRARIVCTNTFDEIEMRTRNARLGRSNLALIAVCIMATSLWACGEPEKADRVDEQQPCATGLERVGTACLAPEGAGHVELVRTTVSSEEGGIVESPDGSIRLDFPPGAIPDDVEVTISAADPALVPAEVLPGSAFVMGPAGLTFNAPVRLFLEVSVKTVGSNINPAHFQLAYIGEAVAPLASRRYDADTAMISGTTMHFSMFGLVPVDSSSNNTNNNNNNNNITHPDVSVPDVGVITDAGDTGSETPDVDAGDATDADWTDADADADADAFDGEIGPGFPDASIIDPPDAGTVDPDGGNGSDTGSGNDVGAGSDTGSGNDVGNGSDTGSGNDTGVGAPDASSPGDDDGGNSSDTGPGSGDTGSGQCVSDNDCQVGLFCFNGQCTGIVDDVGAPDASPGDDDGGNSSSDTSPGNDTGVGAPDASPGDDGGSSSDTGTGSGDTGSGGGECASDSDCQAGLFCFNGQCAGIVDDVGPPDASPSVDVSSSDAI